MARRAAFSNVARLDAVEQLDEVGRVGDVSVVQEQPHPVDVRVLIEMVNASRVERRGPADDPVHLIAFSEQEFRQIGTILPRDAGNECFFHCHVSLSEDCETTASVSRWAVPR